MNTTELVERLAKQLAISKAEAKRLVQAHLEAITHHLAMGDSVVLRGFGTFGIKHTHTHKGYLPNADAEALIPGHRRPHFRPAAKLKAEIQEPEPS
ncbi:MAG: HU family DNA-binding protein [Proteobacteria bacterium]|nr:MAG: HU family DNA-binding protein [Pseudomonadota bacterium]QKK11003.1 MAG: HU family DNA-binding protein [Pseudomonadota bacterium]